MDKELLRLKNIHMYFEKSSGLFGKKKQAHVLNGINLELNYGEILAIVGESGCGKTTIGKIITGLLHPNKGEVIFEGEEVYKAFRTGDQNFRKSVQFIQQDSYAALNPVKTIYQSLAAPLHATLKTNNHQVITEKVKGLLENVGLIPAEQFMYKFPHQLSGGQRQRVLMSRALTQNPKIIVADEPVSMIDVSLRLSILNLMTELNQEHQISFIYITHDLGTARYIANNGRIAVMYLGEIVETGKVNDIIDHPKHPYTQALLSAVPIPDPVLTREVKPAKIKTMELMDLTDRKTGCAFYDRCPYGTDSCTKEDIPYIERNRQMIKCINVDEIPEYESGFKV